MTRLFLLFTVSFLFSTNLLRAQSTANGTIKGVITTNDGHAAPYVVVKIERTKWGANSDENGSYSIANVKPGKWTVKVSGVSTTSQQKEIKLAEGQTVEVNLV